MKRTLVVVHGYEKASHLFPHLYPFWKLGGCDLLGIGHVNTTINWPGDMPFVNVCEDKFSTWNEHNTDVLCQRLVNTFDFLVNYHPEYDDYCIIEWDAIFTKPLPEHPGGLVSTPCGVSEGYHAMGFLANIAFLTPWWADHATARVIVEEGKKLLAEGKFEKGTPDFFLGLICDRTGFKYSGIPAYIQNTIDHDEWAFEARDRFRDKTINYIHGIKTLHVLNQITT